MARPTRIRVHRRPGSRTDGLLRAGALAIPCKLGRTGATRFKREGDGATPFGRMALLTVAWRADRILPPATLLPRRAIRPDDGWCDAATDGRYNRPVRLPCPVSHEEMARADEVYDIVVVLDWNVRRRSLGRGSAIFFHLTRPDRRPTAGCVAVPLAAMRRILALVGRGATLEIV